MRARVAQQFSFSAAVQLFYSSHTSTRLCQTLPRPVNGCSCAEREVSSMKLLFVMSHPPLSIASPFILRVDHELPEGLSTKSCITPNGSTALHTYTHPGYDGYYALMWDLKTQSGRKYSFLNKGNALGNELPKIIGQCALSNSATAAVASTTDGVRLWEIPSGNTIRHLIIDGYVAMGCALTPDGRFLVAVFAKLNEGLVIRVDLNQDLVYEWHVDDSPCLGICFVSDDASVISLVCMEDHTGDFDWLEVRVLDATNYDSKYPKYLRVFTGRLDAYSMDGSGKHVVIAKAKQRSLVVHDVRRHSKPRVMQHYAPLLEWVDCEITRSGKRVVASVANNEYQLWDSFTGVVLARLSGHTGIAQCCMMTSDGLRVIGRSSHNALHVWDLDALGPALPSAMVEIYDAHWSGSRNATAWDVVTALIEQSKYFGTWSFKDIMLAHKMVKYVRRMGETFAQHIPENEGIRNFFSQRLYRRLITACKTKVENEIAKVMLREAWDLGILVESERISIQNSLGVVVYVDDRFQSFTGVLSVISQDFSSRMGAVETEMSGVEGALVEIQKDMERRTEKQVRDGLLKLGLRLVPLASLALASLANSLTTPSALLGGCDPKVSEWQIKSSLAVTPKEVVEGLDVGRKVLGLSTDHWASPNESCRTEERAAIQLVKISSSEEFLRWLPDAHRERFISLIREKLNMSPTGLLAMVEEGMKEGSFGFNELAAIHRNSSLTTDDVLTASELTYKAFLSHEGSEKRTVIDLLLRELRLNGIREDKVFYDDYMKRGGNRNDGLGARLKDGLVASEYLIVFLTPNFLKKKWPMWELKTFLDMMEEDERRKLLPIFYRISARECGDIVKLKISADLEERLGFSGDIEKELRPAMRKVKSFIGIDAEGLLISDTDVVSRIMKDVFRN